MGYILWQISGQHTFNLGYVNIFFKIKINSFWNSSRTVASYISKTKLILLVSSHMEYKQNDQPKINMNIKV